MCGIVGVLRFDAQAPEHAEAQLDAIYHRGPDEQGMWAQNNLFLGNCRLSIIDVEGGSQPLFSDDGLLCIVYNGELYNFLDLRPELEALGHVFRTRSDTEVVLRAYEEWGTECLRRFNGMYAFALWDGRRNHLFVARDRVGEKPLYYFRDDRQLIFASEIKAIIADPSVPREVSEEGLTNYLTFGRATPPQTMFKGIVKLLPGHFMLVRDGVLRIEQYWDPAVELATQGPLLAGADAIAEDVRALLADSVARRMIADVPLGAFLSGGVDSSAIVAFMKRQASAPVKTFSIGFTAGRAYNELAEARQVATALGTEHHELLVEHTDLVQVLRTLVYHYDEPFGDPAGFPVYLLSRFAREHVKVALTGDGGDELFGGYRRYLAESVAPLYQRLPDAVTGALVPAVIDRLPRSARAKRTLHTLPIPDPAARYAAWLTIFSREMQEHLLCDEVWERARPYDPRRVYGRLYQDLHGGAPDHLNRLMYIDLKTLLVDAYLEKTDKASMACSLETRLPLLDHRLVELAFRIPSNLKVRRRRTKHILKEAVAPFVPPIVVQRRKRGFAVPTDPWFRGDLRQFAFDVLLDVRARSRGFFDPTFVEMLWRQHSEGRQAWDMQLWLLLNFELWYRLYMEREAV